MLMQIESGFFLIDLDTDSQYPMIENCENMLISFHNPCQCQGWGGGDATAQVYFILTI